MAGYVLKIVLEDTHPPVWRRVLIPEKITFEELHCVIQIVFGWTNDHLHDFRIPSQRIRIDNEARGRSYYHYIEDETLVDWFLLRYQWVRYTYDFGDEWRHKIIYEKTEESYEERYALLLKAKGDNFWEDSGGVWGIWENEGNRYAFDKIETEERLQNLILPAHDDLDEMMTPDLSKIDIEKIRRELLGKLSDNLKPDMRKSSAAAKPSRMAVKIDGWKQFIDDCYQNKNSGIKENSGYSQMVLPFLQEEPQKSEDTQEPETGDYVLEIVPGVKTCAELLKDLSLKETEDYCKYLQIPVPDTCSKKKMADAIAQEFERRPEYLLYVLEEDEYKELLSLIKSPYGRCEIPQQDDMLIKALGLGLADVAVEKDGGGTRAELSFARDSQSILKSLSVDVRKRIYREIYTFSERLRNIILVYGIVDFDNLFEMFEKIYHVTMEREDFYRYIYWFARYNNLVHTAYLPEGTRYVAALQLDINSVLKKMVQYSDDLDYVIFSEKQLHMMTGEIEKRSMWFDALFTTLRYTLQFPESTALLMTKEVHCEIMNGHSLPVIMNHLSAKLPQEDYLTGICELWTIIVTLMFELELPMLKGRNREEYAEEKGISPWDIGMTDGESASYSLKEQHMYEFPVQIQEAMCLACNFADTQAMDMLWQYKKKERIQSEEYIYLLAQAFIMSAQYERADKVIRLLEKSSVRGKEAVPMLQEMVEQRLNIMDWEDDIMDDWDADAVDFQEDASWIVPRPYVRKAPKIGRNDPCPCGSGKKYKKCCGKNA